VLQDPRLSSYDFKVASLDPNTPNKVSSRLVTVRLEREEVETKEPKPPRVIQHKSRPRKGKVEAKDPERPAVIKRKPKSQHVATPPDTKSAPARSKKSKSKERAAATPTPKPSQKRRQTPAVTFSAPPPALRRGGGGSLVLP
jgi:hypothetical protein